MSVALVHDDPFWRMVARLRQFEGRRCLWRVPAAGLLYIATPAAFVAAAVLVAFIASNGFELWTAALAAVVGLAANHVITTRLAARRLHRRIVADRLWSWEKPNPMTEVPIALGPRMPRGRG